MAEWLIHGPCVASGLVKGLAFLIVRSAVANWLASIGSVLGTVSP